MDTNMYLKDQLGSNPNQFTGLNVSTSQFSVHVEVNPNEFTLKEVIERAFSTHPTDFYISVKCENEYFPSKLTKRDELSFLTVLAFP